MSGLRLSIEKNVGGICANYEKSRFYKRTKSTHPPGIYQYITINSHQSKNELK